MPCLVLANCCASSEAHHSDREAWRCCGEVLWNQCSQTLVKKSWCSMRHLRLRRLFIIQDNDPTMKPKLHKKSRSGQAEISIKLRIYEWSQRRLSTHNLHKTRLSLSSFSKRNGKDPFRQTKGLWSTSKDASTKWSCSIQNRIDNAFQLLNWNLGSKKDLSRIKINCKENHVTNLKNKKQCLSSQFSTFLT